MIEGVGVTLLLLFFFDTHCYFKCDFLTRGRNFMLTKCLNFIVYTDDPK